MSEEIKEDEISENNVSENQEQSAEAVVEKSEETVAETTDVNKVVDPVRHNSDGPVKEETREKTLDNTTASQASENVGDIQFWGDGDTFKLISKASSKKEGWMKSTKAMEIKNMGCVVQVSTQQGDNVAEAVVFVPGVKIQEFEENGVVTSRKLVYKIK